MFSDNFRRGEGKGKGRSGSKAASLAADIEVESLSGKALFTA